MARPSGPDRHPPAWRGLLRAAIATAVTAAAAVALGRAAAATAQGDALSPDSAVALVVLGIACLAAGVLTIGLASLTASTAAGALGGSLRAADAVARQLTPVVVRRVITAGIGVGLGLGGAVTAQAADADLMWVVTEQASVETSESIGPDSAEPAVSTSPWTAGIGSAVGTSAPQRATSTTQTSESARDQTTEQVDAPGPAETPAPAQATHPSTDRTDDDGTVQVRAGDSLWSIAATHLGPEATASEIARAWPRWYDANRDVVGDDPDVIQPGQVLTTPQAPDSTGTAQEAGR